MRIGIVGHFAKGSFSSALAECLNGPLGQTAYIYPVHILPEEYKFRYWRGQPKKRFPLSKMFNGEELDHIICVQACLNIHNDVDTPVLYFHREIERGFAIDKFKHIGLKYPSMMNDQVLRTLNNSFILLPCSCRKYWDNNTPKDLFIADVSRDVSISVYKELMSRAQHILIHNGARADYVISPKKGVSVRALEAFAVNAIPILFVNHLEQDYRDMGFNEDNCYFNIIPSNYDLKKVKAGINLLKKHTILERAKQILEVIENSS